MGRMPCCEKDNVKRGQWTPEEDNKLSSYISQHGTRNWRLIPKNAGLQRCGKSCRLRWTNYLRPDLKHGQFSESEEETIVKLHSVVGNRWSVIAARLGGRTDNDVKNHWNTKLKKKLSVMGIDPVTHKPFSHLMAEIANTLAPAPHLPNLTEAALGCFKDEMLHLLTNNHNIIHFHNNEQKQLEAKMAVPTLNNNNNWEDSTSSIGGFQYGSSSSFGNEDEDHDDWNHSLCSAALFNITHTEDCGPAAEEKEYKCRDEFGSDCVLWNEADLINHPMLIIDSACYATATASSSKQN